MPRNYGRTSTSIWRDKDFRQLSSEARFTYTMLFNQPNVSAAGVLEVTVNRWAGNTGYDVETVHKALRELEERAYIVIDWDAEELFVRSFVRWDGGANNDLRRKAIADAGNAVASDEIRASIAHELDRISVPHGISIAPQSPIDTRRVVVNQGEYSPNPQPSTHEGEPEPSEQVGPPSMFCSKHPNGTEKPCGPCGTAKLRYMAWVKSTAGREAEAKAARAAAIRACGQCDDLGMRVDADERPLGRCDHSPSVSAAKDVS